MKMRVFILSTVCVCAMPFFLFQMSYKINLQELVLCYISSFECVCCYHDYIKIVYYKLGRSYGQTVMTRATKWNRIMYIEEWNRKNSLLKEHLSVHISHLLFI